MAKAVLLLEGRIVAPHFWTGCLPDGIMKT